jgi:hypothetical protein
MPAARLLFALGLSALVACSIAEIPTATQGKLGGGTSPTSSAASRTLGCTSAGSKLEPVDPTTLQPCACQSGGKARCVKIAKMPSQLASELAKCEDDNGACVPDTLVAGGVKAMATCTDQGKQGRCLSLCVPLVAKYASSYLTRGDGDACPSDERCVPCISPLDDSPTGVCEIGEEPPPSCKAAAQADGGTSTGIDVAPGEQVSCPFAGTPADTSRFPACGPNGVGGRCVDASLVADPRIASRLASCDTGLCVPEVYVREKGTHLPTACTSFAGIEGRCFSTVFKDVAAEVDFLDQDKCAADERCVPCFNPATGEATGACSTVSCDAPRLAPVPLQDCCQNHGQMRGKCIPVTDIPGQFQSRLARLGCPAGDLCAPNDNIDPTVTPTPCAAINGRGVCASDCVDFGLFGDIFLDQGNCRSDQTCVPCVDPTTGQPTGAPGC